MQLNCQPFDCKTKSQAICLECQKFYCFSCFYTHTKIFNSQKLAEPKESIEETHQNCMNLIHQLKAFQGQKSLSLDSSALQQQLKSINQLERETINMVQKFFSQFNLKFLNYQEKKPQSSSIKEGIQKIQNFLTVFVPPSNIIPEKQSSNFEGQQLDVKAPSEGTLTFTKGFSPVDVYVPNKQEYKVYQDGTKSYSTTMNQTNIQSNSNKFYIAQVLINKTNQFMVWYRWGRVGVPGQNCLKGPLSKQQALSDYNGKIQDKIMKGNYKVIEIMFMDNENSIKEQQSKKKDLAPSMMDTRLQKLIGTIFNEKIMNTTLKQIGFDTKKMPLGKLGDGTIRQAYTVLNKLQIAIKEKKTDEFNYLSSQFYTLIPHDFGFQKMSNFLINNTEKVYEKLKMLEVLCDIKIAIKILSQEGTKEISMLDQSYEKLGCDIKPLNFQSPDYQLLSEYFNNTKGAFSKVKVVDIYEVIRPTEQDSFSKIGNNMLLWHGSRASTYAGILSQGLRIPPPQAPTEGYLFGKGIYFTDMAEKAIHYCRSYGSDSAFILLAEVAIGTPNILLNPNSQALKLMEQNKAHSTKCHGSKAPPESCYVKVQEMLIPNGPPVPTNSDSYMGHNQYIVYSQNQVKIRYLIEMKMNG